MATSSIEWTDATWNPVTGCTKISPGCKHCYAERMAKRLMLMGQTNYRNAFELTLQPHMLELPLKWKTPKRIFVNSMSDLFHSDLPLSYIKDVFSVMRRAHWHQYQVLTKRSERLLELSSKLEWAPQFWLGVSVENNDYVHRIDHLRKTGAEVKFLSLEPLLGPLHNLNSSGKLIGQSLVANPGREPGLSIPLGRSTSAINVFAPVSRSSSSNGVAFRRKDVDASWTAGRGMKCPNLRSSPDDSRRHLAAIAEARGA